MEEPRPNLRSNPDESRDAPEFDALTPVEDLVRGDRTRDDFLDAVLQVDAPATVEEIADLAGHGTDAAREYLDWFERMGVVTRVTASPATYRRNPDYLTWRRVQRVREAYDSGELLDRLDAETDRDREFAEEFGVDSPEEVSLSSRAATTGQSVEEVWRTLSEWKTTRRRIRILERALTSDESTGRRTVV